jgi:hypothetical protein
MTGGSTSASIPGAADDGRLGVVGAQPLQVAAVTASHVEHEPHLGGHQFGGDVDRVDLGLAVVVEAHAGLEVSRVRVIALGAFDVDGHAMPLSSCRAPRRRPP